MISETLVSELVTPKDAFDAVIHAHEALSRGDAVNTNRARARSDLMSLHTMSGLDKSRNYAGSKVYSALGHMVACHFLLYRISNAELLTIIEAKELGRLRTAAATTVALHALATLPIGVLGVIGAGYQAEGLVRSVAAMRKELGVTEIVVTSRSPERLAQFVASTSKRFEIEVTAVPSANELCERANAVVTATNSMNPVLEYDQLKNVRLVCALGSNALIRRELAPKIVSTANLVVVDETEVAKIEGGNLLPAIETGKLQWRAIWELGAILCGRTVPTFQNGHVVFCSHGLAVQDLALASVVYERAIGQGLIKRSE